MPILLKDVLLARVDECAICHLAGSNGNGFRHTRGFLKSTGGGIIVFRFHLAVMQSPICPSSSWTDIWGRWLKFFFLREPSVKAGCYMCSDGFSATWASIVRAVPFSFANLLSSWLLVFSHVTFRCCSATVVRFFFFHSRWFSILWWFHFVPRQHLVLQKLKQHTEYTNAIPNTWQKSHCCWYIPVENCLFCVQGKVVYYRKKNNSQPVTMKWKQVDGW